MKNFFLTILFLLFIGKLSAQNEPLRFAVDRLPVTNNLFDITDSIIFSEEFTVFPFQNWEIINGQSSSPEGYWQQFVNQTQDTAFATVFWNNGYLQNEWLISPEIYLPADTAYFLSFNWISSYFWMVSPIDGADLNLLISTDGGITWLTDTLWEEDDKIKVLTSGGEFPWQNYKWYSAIIDLKNYRNNYVRFAFQYAGFNGAQVGVDDVLLWKTELTDRQVLEPQKIKIFPNPCSDFIYIEDVEGCMVEIFNLNGFKINTFKSTDYSLQINTSQLPAALYNIRIIKNNSVLYSTFSIFR